MKVSQEPATLGVGVADGTPRGLLLLPEWQQRRWRFREPPIDNNGGLLRSKPLVGGVTGRTSFRTPRAAKAGAHRSPRSQRRNTGGLIVEKLKSTCAWTSIPLIQPNMSGRGEQPISGRGPVWKVGPCTMLGPRVLRRNPPPRPPPLYSII